MSSHHAWTEAVIGQHAEQTPFAPENGKPLAFNIGDEVIFTNPQGVEFSRRVTGFYTPTPICASYARGARYLINSSSPWYPVSESSLRLALND